MDIKKGDLFRTVNGSIIQATQDEHAKWNVNFKIMWIPRSSLQIHGCPAVVGVCWCFDTKTSPFPTKSGEPGWGAKEKIVGGGIV